MKKSTLIHKHDTMKCWKCDGKGKIKIQNYLQQCPLCFGSGKWEEKHYIIIDEQNKIAIDSDTGS